MRGLKMKVAGLRDWLSDTPRSGYGAFLSALATIWPVPSEPVSYPHADEVDALRGDFIQIGQDLKGVIEREAAREQIRAG